MHHPGFGDNIRVLEWVLGRADGTIPASGRPVGWVPQKVHTQDFSLSVFLYSVFCFLYHTQPWQAEMNCRGLEDEEPDMSELLSSPTNFWREEVQEIREYFKSQVNCSLGILVLHKYMLCCLVWLVVRLSLVAQVGDSLPQEMWDELDKMERRVELFAEIDAEEETDNY